MCSLVVVLRFQLLFQSIDFKFFDSICYTYFTTSLDQVENEGHYHLTSVLDFIPQQAVPPIIGPCLYF